MLSADIVVIEIARFFDRVFDDFLRARRLRKLAHGHHLGTTLHKLLDFKANLAQIDVEVLEHVGANARAFLHEAKQNMLSPDVLMVESLGFLVSKRHHFARTVGQSLKHLLLTFCRPRGIAERRFIFVRMLRHMVQTQF